MVLKAKPRGGERTLALICMFARITTRLFRAQTRAWSAAKARHWDHAIAGSSALRSVVLQALRKELAIAHGHQWAVLLWDLAKFHDSFDLLILCAMARRVQYPGLILALLIQQYLAPRVISVGPAISSVIGPGTSILAGCGEAHNMARLILYDLLDHMHICGVHAALDTFVDEMRQYDEDKYDTSLLPTVPAPDPG